jgi:RNA polymerase sigma-70 factor (ECF subfamily)
MPHGLSNAAIDDATLIARVVKENDAGAFALLVRAHEAPLRGFLRRLAKGDHALADDLAQNAFLRAFASLPAFQGHASFRTWLFRIACNEFFQHRRLFRVRRELPLEDLANGATHSLEPEIGGADLSIDLERALASLASAEREAIMVCFYADMSHVEASALLGWSLGTLKSHIKRGRAKLAHYMHAWAPQPENLP